MKRALIFSLIAFAGILLPAFHRAKPSQVAVDNAKYNFGFIRQGEIVSHVFVITNMGDEPLIITDAEVTCKCTTVDFPKAPILKNKKAEIKVTFDSKSAMDRQERTVLVKSNASNSPTKLTFKAVVLKPKN